MTQGRKSEYTPEHNERAKEYLEGWRERDAIPSVASLSRYLGVARSTVYKWAEDNQNFSDTLDDLLAEQEQTLWNMGLTNEFNSTLTKLALTNHGYSDKIDATSKGEKIQGVVVLPQKEE